MPLDTSKYKDQKSAELPNVNGKKQSQTKPAPTPETIPTASAAALTKQAIASSSDALTGQIRALATRMDESDRTLARQLAGYVAERPQRFTLLFAQELAALTAPMENQTFIDVELAAVELPDLRGDFLSIAASSALGCLPM